MRAVAVSLLLLLLGACHAIFPYAASPDDDAGPRDGARGDRGATDGTRDGPRPPGDGPRPPTDVTLPPADGPRPPADGPVPAADVSLPPADGPTAIADAQPPVGGCDPSLASETAVSSSLVFCVSAVGNTFDQCGAVALCNEPTWSVCSATQYRQAFDGSGAKPSVNGAWIWGCVRAGNNPFFPTDGPCTCQENVAPTTTPVSWQCPDNSLVAANSVARHLGLISGGLCQQVGAPDPGAAGYWAPVAAWVPRDRVACCRP